MKEIADKYYVSAGALDGKISLKAHHVFVASKASWYDIDDKKQHFARVSPYEMK